jgi:hypothetical protein
MGSHEHTRSRDQIGEPVSPTRRQLLMIFGTAAAGTIFLEPVAAVAHDPSDRRLPIVCSPIASELFFDFDPETTAALETVSQEIQQAADGHRRLTQQIEELPPFTGNLEQDRALVAALADIELQGLALAEQAQMARLRAIELERQAIVQAEGKAPSESELMRSQQLKIALADWANNWALEEIMEMDKESRVVA